MKNTRRLFAVALATAFAVGCGGGDFAPVSGSVSFQGKPIENASVMFSPQGGGGSSLGVTDAEGHYTLAIQASEQREGAKIGSHRVSISALNVTAEANISDANDLGSLAMIGAPEPKVESRLPVKYGSSATSGLNFEVKPGANEANFDLAP